MATDGYTPGSGDAVAADGIEGEFFQYLKLAYGADGTATIVTTSAPLPTTDATVLAAVDGLEALLTSLGGKDFATQATLAAILAAETVPRDQVSTLTDGRKTVTSAGTALAIRASLACKWVTVTALLTNTTQVNVGGSGVLATLGASSGTPLLPGGSVTIPVSNANLVFVDARTSGEGVSFTVGS